MMAKKTTADAPKTPFITRHDIEEYLELEERRKGLNRESAQIAKQAEVIEQKLEAFVRANGGKEKSLSRSGYVLAIKTCKGSPAWKVEFVKVAGIAASEQLIASAPTRESLTVEKAA